MRDVGSEPAFGVRQLLECASPLAISSVVNEGAPKSGRGQPHSKTQAHGRASLQNHLFLFGAGNISALLSGFHLSLVSIAPIPLPSFP